MRIYLDNCCYNRPYDDQQQIRVSLETQALFKVQELIKNGEIELVSSYVLQFENSQNPYDMRREQIWDYVTKNTKIYVSNSNKEAIDEKATVIMGTGIKYKDASHIACAILAGCDYLLTTDDRMTKFNSPEIVVINPISFITYEV